MVRTNKRGAYNKNKIRNVRNNTRRGRVSKRNSGGRGQRQHRTPGPSLTGVVNPDSENNHRLPGIYKRPKPLRTKEKEFTEDENEGKCRLYERNSSSEEEEETVKRSTKEIDKEKKENRKTPQRKSITEDYNKNLGQQGVVDKHAKKVSGENNKKKDETKDEKKDENNEEKKKD